MFVGHPVIERRARMTGGAALARPAGHRAGCAAAGAAAGQPHQRDPLHLSRLPRGGGVAGEENSRPGHGAAHRAACRGAGCATATEDWPTPLHIVESEADKFAAFDAADVALAASGTVTAELALARTPMVVAYQVGGLTYALANRLMTVALYHPGQYPAGPRGGAGIPAEQGHAAKCWRREWNGCSRDPAARAAQIAAMDEFGAAAGRGRRSRRPCAPPGCCWILSAERSACMRLQLGVARTAHRFRERLTCACPSGHSRARSAPV